MDRDGLEVLRKIGDVSLDDEHQGFCLDSLDKEATAEEFLKTATVYQIGRAHV